MSSWAIVTGASSGIGLELARLLADMDYNLVLVARRQERLEKLKKELEEKRKIEIRTIIADLSVLEDCYRLIDETKNIVDIKVVINNAGFGKVGFVNEISDESDVGMINTNIIAVHILTKHFVSIMNEGNIVNISSIAGTVPGPYMATYGATKAYVLNFSLAYGYELKRRGSKVCITAACPGPVDTEFDKIAGSKFRLRSISAKKCAKKIIKAMKSNKKVVMISPIIKVIHFLSKVSPYALILPVEYEIQIKKLGDK